MALCITAAGFAQVPFFEFGPKVGVNITKIDGQPFKNEFNYGYNAGVFMNLRLTQHIQFAPEVLFNQYSGKTDSSFHNIFAIKNAQNVKLNYLTIPLLLNICPSRIFAFQVGPQYGILLNHSMTLLQNGQQAFKNGDFSLIGGVQLSLGGVKVSGRYFIGLNDISDASNSNMWKNQGFQLSVGLRII